MKTRETLAGEQRPTPARHGGHTAATASGDGKRAPTAAPAEGRHMGRMGLSHFADGAAHDEQSPIGRATTQHRTEQLRAPAEVRRPPLTPIGHSSHEDVPGDGGATTAPADGRRMGRMGLSHSADQAAAELSKQRQNQTKYRLTKRQREMLAVDRHTKTARKPTDCDERNNRRDGKKPQLQLIETNQNQTERDGLNHEHGGLGRLHQTQEGEHRRRTEWQLDGEQSLLQSRLLIPGSELDAAREAKEDELRSITSSASGVEGQIYLGIYTGTRAEIKRGRHGVLRVLIDELIREIGCDARGAEIEKVTEDADAETNGASETWSDASRDGEVVTTATEMQHEPDRGYPRRLCDFDDDQRKRLMCEIGIASDTRDAIRLNQIIETWRQRGGASWDNETGDIGLSAVKSAYADLCISDLARAHPHTHTHTNARLDGRTGRPLLFARMEERTWRGSRGFRYHARLADMGRALRERG